MKPLACANCRKARVRCDHGDPCSRCKARGLKCHTRKRKPYKKPQKRKRAAATASTATRPAKAQKTTSEGALSFEATLTDTLDLAAQNADPMYSCRVDLSMFRMLRALSPSHFLVQSAIKIVMAWAIRRTSMSLMHLVTTFAVRMGINRFPSFSALGSNNTRNVFIGDYSCVPIHVLRHHDNALGFTPIAAENYRSVWATGRIVYCSASEFTDKAVFIASDKGRRLLNLEAAELRALPRALFHVVKSMLNEKDFDEASMCTLKLLAEKYETVHCGPVTACTKNVTFQSPVEGKLKGNLYSTIWLGTKGVDCVNIQEFVPTEQISESARAVVVQGTDTDLSAARAIMNLGKVDP